jgi:hypothetical protein
MNIEVHPDLAAFIADMCTLNGDLTEEGYVNSLLELGVREDLRHDHTEESVRRFMGELRRTEKPDWSLLEIRWEEQMADTKPTMTVQIPRALRDVVAVGMDRKQDAAGRTVWRAATDAATDAFINTLDGNVLLTLLDNAASLGEGITPLRNLSLLIGLITHNVEHSCQAGLGDINFVIADPARAPGFPTATRLTFEIVSYGVWDEDRISAIESKFRDAFEHEGDIADSGMIAVETVVGTTPVVEEGEEAGCDTEAG